VSALIVAAFDDETGAIEMRDALKQMQKQHLLKLEDASATLSNRGIRLCSSWSRMSSPTMYWTN
jgi:uncharacterized membrane protein